ncbi:MAG: DUF2202 domain-containing protein [Spirochaetaceae bacterium]|nr:DUF2202 domain-containing protein [Spirochaetaceae bacterium]MDT8297621.1 DUF2202 domain-containing protein [Spirochaetaceae bacterium]
MKRTSIVILISVLLTVALSAGEGITESQEEGLLYMLEEEKLARDVYTVLGENWNIRVFSNIASSEEEHRSRVQYLADKYRLDYTILPPGDFVDPDLQSLYDQLTAQGLSSLTQAFEVGKAIEVLDIQDLDAMIAQDFPEDIEVVLKALRRGSENHLAAFERQLNR